MLETLAGHSTENRTKQQIRALATVENGHRIDDMKARGVSFEMHQGLGGTCFCGKTGLKESTVIVFSEVVTLVDYKGEKVTGRRFNLGNECINTYSLYLHGMKRMPKDDKI
jgi:hypothetical protein